MCSRGTVSASDDGPDDPGAAVTNGNETGESGKPTRVNPRTAAPAAAHPESAITTAEIPRVSAAPVAQFVRGDGWQPDIERRLPAPWGLQLAVWVLFVIFVVGLVGLAAEHFRPGWVAFLRNTTAPGPRHISTSPTSSTSPGTGSSTTQPGPGLGKLALIAATRTSATYSVPTTSEFSLTVSTVNPCWTLVKSPPTESGFVFAATITAKLSPQVIKLDGPASVALGASASALTIEVGSTDVGSIKLPHPFITYIFKPTGP